MFKKKTVYHSDLVRAGALVLLLKHEPRESQFKGKPDFVTFVVQGQEDQERQYQVENAAILEALASAPLNTWLNFRADGAREAATVAWQPLNPAAPAAAPPPRRQRAAAAPPSQTPATSPTPSSAAEDALFDCLSTAHAAVERYRTAHGPLTDEVRLLATTLYVQRSR